MIKLLLEKIIFNHVHFIIMKIEKDKIYGKLGYVKPNWYYL